MSTATERRAAFRATDALKAQRSHVFAWPSDALAYAATYWHDAGRWHARIVRPPAEIVEALSAPLLDDLHVLVLVDAESRARRLGVNTATIHGFAVGGLDAFTQEALRRDWTDLVPMRMTSPWITCADL